MKSGRSRKRAGRIADEDWRRSIAEKLAARTIKQSSGCWDVQGHALHSGHVLIAVGSHGRSLHRVRAHVFAWEQFHGQHVPPGMVVMHSCDRPRCVRPEHFVLGTQRDNIYDSIHKGRYNTFGRQKLDAAQVREIRALDKQGIPRREIAVQFGIARHTVDGIVNRKSWAHLSDYPTFDEVFERVPSVALPIRGEVA